MRIAYVTSYDPRDVKNWSGLGYFIWKSLAARGVEIELIGPIILPWRLQKLSWMKQRFYPRFQEKFYWPDADTWNARYYSREVDRRLRALPPVDAVLSATVWPSAFLPGNCPLVTYCDSTFQGLFSTYSTHANMAASNRRHAAKIESAAQRRAAALVYASGWAAASARQDYGTDSEKIHIVPFGANLETIPERQPVEQSIAARGREELRLLFIGVEWERKGGDVALAVARQLNQRGIRTQLTVIGCEPKLQSGDEAFVTPLGFIKKDADGQGRIHAELARSHFLIVPSLAECFGIVYCEASAFGVPCIARDVGGVPSAVRNGRNGQLFSPSESPARIADWVAKTFQSAEAYEQLARSARAEYEAELNWTVAGARLEKILRDVIAKK